MTRLLKKPTKIKVNLAEIETALPELCKEDILFFFFKSINDKKERWRKCQKEEAKYKVVFRYEESEWQVLGIEEKVKNSDGMVFSVSKV